MCNSCMSLCVYVCVFVRLCIGIAVRIVSDALLKYESSFLD